MAVVLAAALLVPRLADLTSDTRRFTELGLRDAGRIPQPLPEEVVRVALRELRPGETWSLHTAAGACPRNEQLFWLAFRLQPHTSDCRASDVAIHAGVAPPPGADVVRSGRGFVVVRS